MKLQEVDINRALGLRLGDELNLNNQILAKNHALTSDDITLLKQAGYSAIFGAWAENGDIDFDTALGMAAAKISGQNLGFKIDERGFCEIAATTDGLFDVSTDRLAKFNRFSEFFILNTIPPFQTVKSGDIVARLEIMTPVIPQDTVEELVFSLSGNDSLLSVRAFKEQQAAILYTRLYHNDNEDEHLREAAEKLAATCRPLAMDFAQEDACEHTIEDTAAAIDNLLHSPANIIFVIPAQRNYTAQGVISSAVESVADTIVCQRLPLFGASDLIIAVKKNKKIICLPYNYAFVDSAVLENFIKSALLKPKLQVFDFNHPDNSFIDSGSHLKDISTLIRSAPTSANKANIAAVVLAAGQSKRLGKNKLLADINGEPLAIKTIRAAIQSDASPVFAVTGYQAEELETALENMDINIVYNANYNSGIKTSISLGLKSVPDACDGALLIPADMPNITPELINKMIAKFKKKSAKQLVLAERNGIKSNPVLWSKALYAQADLAAENADIRPIFMEHSDYTTPVKASENELLDVNFQSDLDRLLKA